MKKIDNRGISLVELIIVIAIMAVLAAIIAPQLLKYVEKAKISSDEEYLDSIYKAVTYASSDPDVVQDPNSMLLLTQLSSAPMTLSAIEAYKPGGTETLLSKEVKDTLGWSDLNHANYIAHIRSWHTSSSDIYIQYKGTANNPLAAWITDTDVTGKKGEAAVSNPSEWKDLDDPACHIICIY
ncbi:prepilin-type N-terminal cleavage/methylation domain-containing protein [Lachnospiraceae bacterium XPB1003]|nr:prepilin-type N-terminal cleavage/methylation domain-containing protein [Lachnospiraceae bacterium XPB1003]